LGPSFKIIVMEIINVSSEMQMTLLFEAYYQQCPHRKIAYTTSEVRDGYLQSWICMNGIEMSYMMYQGEYQIIFMCSRYCDEVGGDANYLNTFYFKTYEECLKVWEMNESELYEFVKILEC
jgi:hypothetical protein